MRALLLALLAPCTAYADGVELYPRSAIEAAAKIDEPAPVPISPAWRGVEHATFEEFAPKLRQVTDDSPAKLLAKQSARHVDPKTPYDRAADDSRATPSDPLALQTSRTAQVDAVQAAYEEPVDWRAVELEVVVHRDGTVSPVRVVHASENAAFDAAAVAALERAVSTTSAIAGKRDLVAHVRVEAGASVAMPGRGSIAPTPSGRPRGGVVTIARGRFGGGRKTEVSAPLQPRVRTRVTLLDVTPAP